ncbi:MAG: low molecular weight phosphotyrosine protein phosphatase [Chloroflexi bacterium]|nr:low molecular weight phosphotyrosine protein phosphatase [Chloroflexota bacterium]
MAHVVFVCLGNICRSPMAEGIFNEMIRQRGLKGQITVDSVGTGGWHEGETAHPGTRQILAEHGITYVGQARQIQAADLSEADYLVAMDTSNLNGIKRLGETHAELFRLLDLVPKAGTKDVPDPYYTGDFETVYNLVYAGCEALLEKIVQQEGLQV